RRAAACRVRARRPGRFGAGVGPLCSGLREGFQSASQAAHGVTAVSDQIEVGLHSVLLDRLEPFVRTVLLEPIEDALQIPSQRAERGIELLPRGTFWVVQSEFTRQSECLCAMAKELELLDEQQADAWSPFGCGLQRVVRRALQCDALAQSFQLGRDAR